MNKFLKVVLVVILTIAAGRLAWQLILPKPLPTAITPEQTAPEKIDMPAKNPEPAPNTASPERQGENFIAPLDRLEERLNKKFFGQYVTPANSPVQPEKFTGYHTGLDLETFSDEADREMPVKTICGGPLKEKRLASGYGGVAVQECLLDNRTITVIYGHLKLDSINHQINNFLNPGETLGVLGKGYSKETDGERKHLHLGIHLGSQINIKGYVGNESELKDWLDPLKIFNK